MSTVTLNLFVEGLLLFVPQTSDGKAQVEVLMADARNPPYASDGCPNHPHEAVLVAEGKCATILPTPVPYIECAQDAANPNLCRCELERVDVNFCGGSGRRCGAGCSQALDDLKTIAPPFPPAGLRRWSKKLKEELVCGSPVEDEGARCWDSTGVPKPKTFMRNEHEWERLLIARAHFVPKETRACNTRDGRLCMLFRSLSRRSMLDYPHMSAEVSRFKIQIPDLVSDPQYIRVHVRTFDRKASTELRLPVRKVVDANGNNPRWMVDALIGNQMKPGHIHQEALGRCSDDGIGRHFELLYDLLDRPADLEKRIVPYQRVRFQEESIFNLRDCNEDEEYEMVKCESPVLDGLLELLRARPGKPICNTAVGGQ